MRSTDLVDVGAQDGSVGVVGNGGSVDDLGEGEEMGLFYIRFYVGYCCCSP